VVEDNLPGREWFVPSVVLLQGPSGARLGQDNLTVRLHGGDSEVCKGP
jgi:hypothetical protein